MSGTEDNRVINMTDPEAKLLESEGKLLFLFLYKIARRLMLSAEFIG